MPYLSSEVIGMNHEKTVASMNTLPEGITVLHSPTGGWLVFWLDVMLTFKVTLPAVRDYLLDTYGVEWMPS